MQISGELDSQFSCYCKQCYATKFVHNYAYAVNTALVMFDVNLLQYEDSAKFQVQTVSEVHNLKFLLFVLESSPSLFLLLQRNVDTSFRHVNVASNLKT